MGLQIINSSSVANDLQHQWFLVPNNSNSPNANSKGNMLCHLCKGGEKGTNIFKTDNSLKCNNTEEIIICSSFSYLPRQALTIFTELWNFTLFFNAVLRNGPD